MVIDRSAVISMGTVGVVHERFGIANGLRTSGQDAIGELDGFMEHLSWFGDSLEKAYLLGSRGGDWVPDQEQFGQISFSDFGAQYVGDEGWQQATTRFREPKLQIAGSHRHIARSDDACASGVRTAMHCGDRDQWRESQAGKGFCYALSRLANELHVGGFCQVQAGAEHRAGPAKDEDACGLVLFEVADHLDQFLHHRDRQRIASFGATQGDDRDALFWRLDFNQCSHEFD